jgi:hypothetical protein
VPSQSSAGRSTARIGVFPCHRGALENARVAAHYIPSVGSGCIAGKDRVTAVVINCISGDQTSASSAIDANGFAVVRDIAGDQTSIPAAKDAIPSVAVRGIAGDHAPVNLALYSGRCGVVCRAAFDHRVVSSNDASSVRIGVHVSDNAEVSHLNAEPESEDRPVFHRNAGDADQIDSDAGVAWPGPVNRESVQIDGDLRRVKPRRVNCGGIGRSLEVAGEAVAPGVYGERKPACRHYLRLVDLDYAVHRARRCGQPERYRGNKQCRCQFLPFHHLLPPSIAGRHPDDGEQ